MRLRAYTKRENSNACMHEVREKEDDERYVECSFRRKINPVGNPEKALSAREINRELGTNWFFRQTRFSISDEEANRIEKLFMKKSK